MRLLPPKPQSSLAACFKRGRRAERARRNSPISSSLRWLVPVLVVGGLLGLALPPGIDGADRAAAQAQSTALPPGLAETRLHAGDYQAHDLFGSAVDVDGPVLAAGAPGVDVAGPQAGGLYVFEQQDGDWMETARLVPADLSAEARLGLAVALDGDALAAGAPYATTRSGGFAAGAVYIFVRQGEGWREQARLTAPDGGPFDLFGGAIALHGDTLLVGAQGADDPENGRNAGAAYVFQREGDAWVQEARLSSPDGAMDDFFGQAVALHGDVIAVGAYGHDDPAGGPNSGAVYLFRRRDGEWFYHDKLTSAGPAAQAQFGFSLEFAGPGAEPDWLAIGANQYAPEPLDPRYDSPPGRVEVFRRQAGSWAPAAQLGVEVVGERETGLMGAAVALEILNGNRFVLFSGSQFGVSVHLYPGQEGAWGTPLVVQPENDQLAFGRDLAVHQTTLVVGSPRSGERLLDGEVFREVPQSGAVFIFDLSGLEHE